MSLYKRSDSDFYSYDFQLDGRRYSGSTGTDDLQQAQRFEQTMRNDANGVSILCRSVIRRAARKLPTTIRSNSGYVYMIRSGYFIKIGHSNDPASRLKSISTATPDDCEVLFCIPGDVKLERRLHTEFAACHYKKEWFFLCGKLKQFVDEFEVADAKSPTEITVRQGDDHLKPLQLLENSE